MFHVGGKRNKLKWIRDHVAVFNISAVTELKTTKGYTEEYDSTKWLTFEETR